MCDCIPINEIKKLKFNKLSDEVFNELNPFILMIKADDVIKGQIYSTNLISMKGSYNESSSFDLLSKHSNFAYSIIDGRFNFYNYDRVQITNEDFEMMNKLCYFKLPYTYLTDGFLDSEMHHLSNQFKIYNSGEGLCSALLNKENHPYFIYDIGQTMYCLPGNKGKDFSLYLADIKWICISHRHLDHFNYLLKNISELKNVKLIINENFISNHSITLNKIMYYYAKNHHLYYLKERVAQKIKNGKIELFSDHNQRVSNQDAHRNNICLKISGKKTILLTGDNYYDSFDFLNEKDIDYLCATHHGGKYWKNDLSCIPNNEKKGLLIVATSGEHYGHPSELDAYRKKGWRNIKFTYNGDIIIDF